MTQAFELEETNELKQIISMGFPTFEEFRKNPDKYRTQREEFLNSADVAHVAFKAQLTKVKHVWRGRYQCDSLEHLQRVCNLDGFREDQIEAIPKVIHLGGTGHHAKYEIISDWYPRDEYRLMGGVVAND